MNIDMTFGYDNNEFALAFRFFKKTAFLSNYSHFDRSAFYMSCNIGRNHILGFKIEDDAEKGVSHAAVIEQKISEDSRHKLRLDSNHHLAYIIEKKAQQESGSEGRL